MLSHIPDDNPPVGSYNHDSEFFTYARRDMKIPNMRKYTPKALGMTVGKHGSYYGACPDDSFDPVQSFKACVEGTATTKFKKTVTKAVMDK